MDIADAKIETIIQRHSKISAFSPQFLLSL